MKTYAVHSATFVTQDLTDMLEDSKYPTPAHYDDLYLFSEPHKNPTIPIVDLRHIETKEELEFMYEALVTEEHTGRWIYLNKWQGAYLKQKYFPDELITE